MKTISVILNYFGSKIDLKKAGDVIKNTMPPRKNNTTAAATPVVATPAPVATPVAAPAKQRAAKSGKRTFRIVTEGEHNVVPGAGCPMPTLVSPPAEGSKSKKPVDRRFVEASTPGQASKKAFTKLVRNSGRADSDLSYTFSIQEVLEGGVVSDKVHTYVGTRTKLAVPKSVARKGADGTTTEIPINFTMTVTSAKPKGDASGSATPRAPRKPRAPKAAAEAAAPAPAVVETPVAAEAPKGKGRGKGKGK
jgi:hypothetical protein